MGKRDEGEGGRRGNRMDADMRGKKEGEETQESRQEKEEKTEEGDKENICHYSTFPSGGILQTLILWLFIFQIPAKLHIPT